RLVSPAYDAPTAGAGIVGSSGDTFCSPHRRDTCTASSEHPCPFRGKRVKLPEIAEHGNARTDACVQPEVALVVAPVGHFIQSGWMIADAGYSLGSENSAGIR